MQLSVNKINKSLSPSYRLLKPKRSDIEVFKASFGHYLSVINSDESEENLKTHLMDFLKTLYFPEHLIEQQKRIDFVIRTGKKNSNAGVLFEAKRFNNTQDMISQTEINKKALHELVLYFMEERKRENTDIKYLIICNEFEVYIFEAKEFERAFYKNSAFRKDFIEWSENKKSDNTTDFFYNSIAKPFIAKSKLELHATSFDMRDFSKLLTNDTPENDLKLIPLLKILSPEHLLKKSYANDSNSLNKQFYNELLHIIGLEEVKKNKKVVIQRIENLEERSKSSLIENTISKLVREDDFSRTDLIRLYGTNNEERAFSIALELCITWINRLLFLKLLESQIVSYHNNDKSYLFLNNNRVKDYDGLVDLFFGVLAFKPEEREQHLQEKYSKIPYLNSSLFEKTELEKIVGLSHLNSDFEMCLYSKTILKDKKNKPKYKSITTLNYVFEFLDAYDFASEGEEGIQEESKTLINASVLGLIFEKINGYKEGAVFTPGYVTTYMSKVAIENAVIQKFQEHYPKWNIKEINDIRNFLADHRSPKDILNFNSIINSIKICDPAVGSGHFLVSCLNEIIAIKSKLGILADENGNRLSEYNVEIDNDEIVLTHSNDNSIFKYHLSGSKVSENLQSLQKGLFTEKQKIIENCLFGVDINTNSVKICQLRLWIELLKNAYYTKESNYTSLETLPNIDINIKQGNSLLYRYGLEQTLSDVFKGKIKVGDYKALVENYKNTKNRQKKKELENKIEEIKQRFKNTIEDNFDVQINTKKEEIKFIESQTDLFLNEEKSKKSQSKKLKEIQGLIKSLEQKKKDFLDKKTYTQALEWRFEFPEILDEKGKFEGFDIIIANPPYVRQEEIGHLKPYLEESYNVYSGTADLYSYFFELGLRLAKKNTGQLVYICSNTFFKTNGSKNLRSYLKQQCTVSTIIDYADIQIFDGVTTYPAIFELINGKPKEDHKLSFCKPTENPKNDIESYFEENAESMEQNHLEIEQWNLQNEEYQSLINKIKNSGSTIKELSLDTYRGILTGFNEAFIVSEELKNKLVENDPKSLEVLKPLLEGKDIKKWHYESRKQYLIFTKRGINLEKYPAIKTHLLKYKKRLEPKPNNWPQDKDWGGRKSGSYKWYEIQDTAAYFEEFETQKIVWGNLQSKPQFCLDNQNYYINAPCPILPNSSHFLCGLLNSNVLWFALKDIAIIRQGGFLEAKPVYVEQLPIPEANDEKKEAIGNLAKKAQELSETICSLKINNSDNQKEIIELTDNLNNTEISLNAEIYKLFKLSNDEIKFIEENI